MPTFLVYMFFVNFLKVLGSQNLPLATLTDGSCERRVGKLVAVPNLVQATNIAIMDNIADD